MPQSSLGSISNDLFAVVMVVYALAMLAFAAELAFSRRGAVAARDRRISRAAPAQQYADKRTLVGAGVGAPSAPDAARDEAADPPAGGSAVEAGERPPRGAARAGVVAFAVTGVGWLVHAAEVVTRGLAAHRVPWGNMYEFSSAVCLVAVGGFLVLAFRQKARWLGVFVMVPVVLYLGLAGTVLYTNAAPLPPVLQSYWLKIHVVAAIAATGTFMVAGVVSCLHLVRRRFERLTAAGRAPRLVGIGRRLPVSATLDRVEYRIIAFAFPIWTFAVIAGAIWAESAWGRYWNWDPKETWSFITWVVYAAYLHARSTAGWRKAAPTIALAGFVALVVNYYIVNLLIVGMHSYARA